MNKFYENMNMPEEFLKAVDVIQHYCQNEYCTEEECTNCPYPLHIIRCDDVHKAFVQSVKWLYEYFDDDETSTERLLQMVANDLDCDVSDVTEALEEARKS